MLESKECCFFGEVDGKESDTSALGVGIVKPIVARTDENIGSVERQSLYGVAVLSATRVERENVQFFSLAV